MPAIQLTRLRLQAAHLRDSFTRPEAFVRGLQAMLEFYTDHTHRSGQAGKPPPLIPAYHVPAPVLRQVLLELKPQISSEPERALLLSDSLWSQKNLECRVLATSILGLLPASYADPVLERVEGWAKAEKEDQLLESILDQGLSNYRRELPARLLGLVERWLHSESLHEQRLGLIAIVPVLEEGRHENLPAIFRLLTPLTRAVPKGLRLDLIKVLIAAAHSAPRETAFFLRQTLASPDNLDTAKLVRQLIPEFPAETRMGLRDALRQIGK